MGITNDHDEYIAATRWVIFARVTDKPDRKWVEWERYFSEADGLETLAAHRRDYPHYEIELRKRTTTEERVDA